MDVDTFTLDASNAGAARQDRLLQAVQELKIRDIRMLLTDRLQPVDIRHKYKHLMERTLLHVAILQEVPRQGKVGA